MECHNCGTRLEEWNPKEGGDRQAYVAQTYLCPGCTQIGGKYDDAMKSARKGDANPHGIKVRLIDKQTYLEQLRKGMKEREAVRSLADKPMEE